MLRHALKIQSVHWLNHAVAEMEVVVQVIIEKAYENVQKDHVKDALSLFVDFMAIFVSFP